jgi:hypothetical protein
VSSMAQQSCPAAPVTSTAQPQPREGAAEDARNFYPSLSLKALWPDAGQMATPSCKAGWVIDCVAEPPWNCLHFHSEGEDGC